MMPRVEPWKLLLEFVRFLLSTSLTHQKRLIPDDGERKAKKLLPESLLR